MLFLVVSAIVALCLAVFWVEPLSALGVIERLTPNIIYRVRTGAPLVALSFDDGPDPTFTPQVLDILRRHQAKATFFLIGEKALRHPELVTHIKSDGHEIGNHYYRNGAMLLDGDVEFLRNLEKQTQRAIDRAGQLKLFRARAA